MKIGFQFSPVINCNPKTQQNSQKEDEIANVTHDQKPISISELSDWIKCNQIRRKESLCKDRKE